MISKHCYKFFKTANNGRLVHIPSLYKITGQTKSCIHDCYIQRYGVFIETLDSSRSQEVLTKIGKSAGNYYPGYTAKKWIFH